MNMAYNALFSLKENSRLCSLCGRNAIIALLYEESNFTRVGLVTFFCDSCCKNLSKYLKDNVLVGEKFFINNMHFKEKVHIYENASFIFKQHSLKDYTKLLKNASFS